MNILFEDKSLKNVLLIRRMRSKGLDSVVHNVMLTAWLKLVKLPILKPCGGCLDIITIWLAIARGSGLAIWINRIG